MNWWQHLRKKWDDWCGDHEMEMSIRGHLTRNGYFGHTAKFEAVRLVAVQRPGWLQVYRFEVTARVNPGHVPTETRDADASSTAAVSSTSSSVVEGRNMKRRDMKGRDTGGPDLEGPSAEGADPKAEYHRLYGLVREDIRQNRSNVRVFEAESERKELFDRWSDGLICLRGAKGLLNS